MHADRCLGRITSQQVARMSKAICANRYNQNRDIASLIGLRLLTQFQPHPVCRDRSDPQTGFATILR